MPSGGTIKGPSCFSRIVKIPLVSEMLEGARQSCEDLRASIVNVKFAGFSADYSCQLVSFEIVEGTHKGGKFIGKLRGRNADLCLGFGEEQDKGIAARVLIDGDAKRI